MTVSRKILIDKSHPFDSDPNPASCLVFRDTDGRYYNVHSTGVLRAEVDHSIWAERRAIEELAIHRPSEKILVPDPNPDLSIPKGKPEESEQEEENADAELRARIDIAIETLEDLRLKLNDEEVKRLRKLLGYKMRRRVIKTVVEEDAVQP